MNAEAWATFEALVREFYELREVYRCRKAQGTLGREVEDRMIQMLNGMEVRIDRLRSGDELSRARKSSDHRKPPIEKTWRIAQ